MGLGQVNKLPINFMVSVLDPFSAEGAIAEKSK